MKQTLNRAMKWAVQVSPNVQRWLLGLTLGAAMLWGVLRDWGSSSPVHQRAADVRD